jgi:hypothetical protein
MAPPTPRVDPAEIWTLLGRVVAALVLFTGTVMLLIAHRYPFALITGLGSAAFQGLALRQRRRLMREDAERQATHAPR